MEVKEKNKETSSVFYLFAGICRKKIFKSSPKNWKMEYAQKLLNDAWEMAYTNLGCTEQILALPYESCEENMLAKLLASSPLMELPVELWAVGLYQARPFDSLCILLPEDAGRKETERLQELLEPYLPRMKRIIYKGQESKVSSWLTDYLYEEFGIVMMGVQKLPSDMPVLDFGIQEWGSRKLSSSSGAA